MAKTITKTNRPRLTLDMPPTLRRRIKMAAAAQEVSVSAYVTRLLDRTVPPARVLKKAADGSISFDTLRRFVALRNEQRAPFPEDSAELIRTSRAERENHL